MRDPHTIPGAQYPADFSNLVLGVPCDGQFDTFGDWVRTARDSIGGMNALCLDARGRRCCCGGDFRRARDEGAFPVTYWFGLGGQSAAEQHKCQRLAERQRLMEKPWRRHGR